MNGPDVAYVGLAGGLGALTRYLVDGAVVRRVGSRVPAGLPVGTMGINVSGSLLLGVLAGIVLWHHVTPTLSLVAGTGFCGGYTTFGTSSLEGVRLLQRGAYRLAAVAVVFTLLPALGGAAAGLYLASL